MIDAVNEVLDMGFPQRDMAQLEELEEGFAAYNVTDDSPFRGTVAAGDGVVIPVIRISHSL